MKYIDVATTLKYTKDLSLLYAEDDVNLQKHTKELFDSLFKSVKVVNNGEEAFDAYMSNGYDMLISDIKMPKMDGVSLVKEIKKINVHQEIIITSAYNDNEYLLQCINLNVSHFIMKPVSSENLLDVIHKVAKNIINAKMVETYRKELEASNVSLKEKNDELQGLVRILDSKLAQISSSQSPANQNIDYERLQVSKEHLDELREIETDISGASVLISLSKNITEANIKVLGDMFNGYAKVISSYDAYEELNQKIKSLAEVLSIAPENFIKKVDDISILLESFIYVLRMWRNHLDSAEMKKAFALHASMTNDIDTIIAIINDTQNDIESEMEFF